MGRAGRGRRRRRFPARRCRSASCRRACRDPPASASPGACRDLVGLGVARRQGPAGGAPGTPGRRTPRRPAQRVPAPFREPAGSVAYRRCHRVPPRELADIGSVSMVRVSAPPGESDTGLPHRDAGHGPRTTVCPRGPARRRPTARQHGRHVPASWSAPAEKCPPDRPGPGKAARYGTEHRGPGAGRRRRKPARARAAVLDRRLRQAAVRARPESSRSHPRAGWFSGGPAPARGGADGCRRGPGTDTGCGRTEPDPR